MDNLAYALLAVVVTWILWDIYERRQARRMNDACDDEKEVDDPWGV